MIGVSGPEAIGWAGDRGEVVDPELKLVAADDFGLHRGGQVVDLERDPRGFG